MAAVGIRSDSSLFQCGSVFVVKSGQTARSQAFDADRTSCQSDSYDRPQIRKIVNSIQ
jgi:hypothetical protein